MLLDRGISNWLRRVLFLVLAAAIAASVWIWAKQTLPPVNSTDMTDIKSVLDYVQRVLAAGPALYILFPFRLIVRPFLAPDAATFLVVLMPALLIFLLHYLWVIYSDVSFEEASLEASQKMASRIAAMRAGNWHGAVVKEKAMRAWFNLPPCGPASTALFWKNLIGIGQSFSMRFWIMIVVVVLVLCVTLGATANGKQLYMVVEGIIAICLGYSLFLGPQVLRVDFRRDLPQADILKTFPLRGWQIALGELLAPTVILAGFQWMLLLIGSGLLFYVPGKYQALFLGIMVGLIVLLPVFDFFLLLIPNATILMFPSWFQTGKDSPRGIEATGQRLILALGQMLFLVVALLPAGLAFLGVFFLLRLFLDPALAVPFASVVAAIVVAAEGGVGVMLLGTLFERFDVADEQTN